MDGDARLKARALSNGLALSTAQREVWREHAVFPDTPVHTVGVYTVVSGPFDPELLERALAWAWDRHDALRLSPSAEGDGDEPVQREVAKPDRFLTVHDLSASGSEDEALALAENLGRRAIPLDGGPTFRFDLVHLAPDRHVWVMCYHHINMDAWANGILVRDVAAAYSAFAAGEEPDLPPAPSFREAVEADGAFLESARYAKNRDYWRSVYSTLPDRLVEGGGGVLEGGAPVATRLRRVAVDQTAMERIRATAKDYNTTPARLFMAASLLVLHRQSGARDVVFGMPVLNRPTARDKETFGLFSLATAPRVEIDPDDGVEELLARLDRAMRDAMRHNRFPLSEVNRHLELASRRVLQLFDLNISYERVDYGEIALGPATGTVPRVLLNGTARTPVEVFVREYGDAERVEVDLDLSGAVFDEDQADRLAERFDRVLTWLSSGGRGLVSSVPLVSGSERAWLLDGVNATAKDYGAFVAVPRMIEAVAAAHPERAALRFEGVEISYGELNARANALARRLQLAGVGPEVRVGVALERSVELVVSLLGVMKAGGAYVPLDPELPADRLSFMVSDAAAPVVVTRRALLAQLPEHDGQTVTIDDLEWGADANPEVSLRPEHLAYVIYTSGSTGRPKGVMNHHLGLRNRLLWMQEAFSIGPEDRVLQKTPFTFDVSVWEFFWPLMMGSCLVVARPGGHRDPDYLAGVMRDEGISVLHFVPSMLQAFLGHGPSATGLEACSALRTVVCSGEALTSALVERFYRHAPSGASLDNLYGPTEAAIDVTHWACGVPAVEPVPIGHAIANTSLYVLDGALEPVPVGVVGELWIGGVQVSRGYLGRAGLTSETFVADPHVGVAGARMYRTGDLARRRADGALEYLGRIDHQVKLRGFRIELGEIESVLLGHGSVREAAVLLREDRSGDPRLVAYLVTEGGVVPADLTGHLRTALPEHMVPSDVMVLDALPVTANGKLDRRALPAPQAGVSGSGTAPRGPEEEVACAVFAGVLGREEVGAEDNFFALGGHSLLAVQAVGRLRSALNIDLPANAVLASPTARDLATRIRNTRSVDAVELPERAADAPRPASSAEARLWFLQSRDPSDTGYNMTGAVDLADAVDLDALCRALAAVQRRHPSLHSVMEVRDEVVWVVPSADRVTVPVVEDGVSAEQADAIERTMAETPFDLGSDLPFRARLLRLADGRTRLVIAFHHAGADAESVGVFGADLEAAYRAALRAPDLDTAGLADGLPAPSGDALRAEELSLGRLDADAALERWTRRLAGVAGGLDLPRDGRSGDRRVVTTKVRIDSGLRRRLARQAADDGATLFMLLHAGLSLLLHRLTGQDDIVIGTPVSLRADETVARTVGMLLNTVPLRLRFDATATSRELARQARDVVTSALADAGTPLERIVAAVDADRAHDTAPLFQTLLTTHPPHLGTLALDGTSTSVRVVPQYRAKLDLVVLCADDGEGVEVTVESVASLFSEASARQFAAMLLAALEAVADSPDLPVGAVSLMGPEAWASETTGPDTVDDRRAPEGAVPAMFRQAASAHPDESALEDGTGRRLSYRELDALSDRIAAGLRANGVGRGDRVGVRMTRGVDQIVVLLATLKAGGAYVPLDPEQPEARLDGMAADAAVRLVVVDPDADDRADEGDGHTLETLSAAGTGAVVDPELSGTDTAYVMFTSGSTGRPKGIAVPHQAVLRLAIDPGFARFEPGKRVAQVATTAFDAATYEIWCALLNGATCVVVDREATYEPEALAAAFQSARAQSTFLTVSVFNRAVRAEADAFSTFDEVMFGGEAADPDAVRTAVARWPGVRFVNGYGPTETTTFAACHSVTAVEEGARTVPIGRPIRSTALYVLDGNLNPVPRGVAGELFIGGQGLADGYVGQPGQTADVFLADPFTSTPGARMYRTGDRVRRRIDGAVEYLGRIDRQIKLRGFRIEPGDIEAAVRGRLDTDNDVIVDVRSTGDDRALFAWVVGGEIDPARERALRSALTGDLPGWMVPRRILDIAEIPLTPNGKLDRDALPMPAEGDTPALETDPARTETERKLAEIWSDLLDGAAVGRGDGFFQSGGHSLLGVRLIARIRDAFGVELPLRAVFDRPTLADMADAIDSAAKGTFGGIVRASRSDDRRPAAPTQSRLALMDRIDGSGIAYTIPVAALLDGHLDPQRLERALRQLLQRHEALATVVDLVDGKVTARVRSTEDLSVTVEDRAPCDREAAHAALVEAAEVDAMRPFDLAHDLPVRGRVIHFGDSLSGLQITVHHIAADGHSMPIFMRELAALYNADGDPRAAGLAELPVAYADWVDAMGDRADDPDRGRAIADAVAALEGAPDVLEVPVDRQRPSRRSHTGGMVRFAIPTDVEAAVSALARQWSTTPFAMLTTAYAMLLARLSGARDVVLGVPVAGRSQDETLGLIGFFADTGVLRVRFDDDPAVQDLVGRVHADLSRVLSDPVPFDALVDALDLRRDTSHTAVFQAMIALNEDEMPAVAFADAAAEPVLVHPGTAKFDLQLQVVRQDGQLQCGLEFAADIFDEGTVRGFADRFVALLGWLSAGGRGLVSSVPLVSESERAWLLDTVNATATDYGSFVAVPRMIEAVAAARPERAAVRFEGVEISYGELNARANALARRLQRAGVGPEVRVGVALERSVELVVSLLGVMKAGGAYVPLDPELPADRLSFMVSDAAAAVVVTRNDLLERLPAHGGRTIAIDGLERRSERGSREGAGRRPDANPEVSLRPEHLAYVIYTSGSTGRPKGVMNHHLGLRNRLLWMQEAFSIGPEDRVLQKTPFTFDVSVWEFFWPLMMGSCLVVARPGGHRDPDYLAGVMRDEGISVLHFVPSMLQAFLGHGPSATGLEACSALRTVVCSGEALTSALVERFYRHAPSGASLDNLYGPTEAAIDVTHWACGVPAVEPVPIGHAIANTSLYVLDGALEPVPVGVVGELWIGGVQVSRGYLGRAGLTSETFVADPHAGVAGARMYRTGDLARRRADGALEYLGRIDHQVKLRGFRIELGEIESVLLGHGSVREAAVLLREDRSGDPRLVAYLVTEGGVVPADLTGHLRTALPEHMVPSDVMVLDALPVTANGKLDRRALPAPQAGVSGSGTAPRGPEEEVACAVFAGVLGREEVGAEDNFFALGGHSLLAVQAVGRLRSALNIDLPANALFEDATPRRIAERVKAGRDLAAVTIPRRAAETETVPSPSQRQLWFLCRMEGSAAYNVPDGFIVDGPLDFTALSAAVSDVVARHEALRTVLPERAGEPVAEVMGPQTVTISLDRLDSGADDDIRSWFRQQALRPFAIDSDIPIRVSAARLPDGRHALAIVLHHLATDGASAPVLYRDLAEAYHARCRGRAYNRPEPEVRYYDWAAWQQDRLESEAMAAALERAKQRLSGIPETLNLPEDLVRRDPQAFSGQMLRVPVPVELAVGLRTVARRANATLFMVLLAGLVGYLNRISGQDDIVIGAPVSGRDRADTEDMVGFMVNTVPLRLAVDPGDTLGALVDSARREVLDAFADQDLPLDRIVRAVSPDRARSRTPLFRALLVLQPADRMRLDLDGAMVSPVNIDAVSARYDLTFALDDHGHGLDLVLHYADDLFTARTARRMAAGFERVLHALVDTPEQTIGRLSLLADRDLRRETGGSDVVDGRSPPPEGIAARFRSVVAENGDRPALEDAAGVSLSYAELDAVSDRVAAALDRRNIGRGQRVGLHMQRGPDQVIAMLGVLKAGAAYIPLDPEQPTARLAQMALDGSVDLVVSDAVEPLDGLPPGCSTVSVSDLTLGEGSVRTVDRTARDTAYVMFTSGSTGRPKGIAIPDRAVLRLVLDPGYLAFSQGRRVAQIATTAFDAATFEIWGPLLTGGTCVIIDRAATYDPSDLASALARARVDAAFLTTAVFNRAARSEAGVFDGLADVLFGGEAVDPDAVRVARDRWPELRVTHVYGPTETTTFASFFPVTEVEEGVRTVPIGRPIRATALYVLDENLMPVPRGVPGELYIGGDGLADGYVGRPGQTAETFQADPFASAPGARMYRTGDLVRRRDDGALEYLGRIDRQIKLRGFRIEPGEIEAAIRRAVGSDVDAFVDARRTGGQRGRTGDDHVLFGWVAGTDVTAEGEKALREALATDLPDWMVPRRIVALDRLPLTPNGKVDRAALTTPIAADGQEAPVSAAAFETETQQLLASLWSELLDGAHVGKDDSFFALGGHSLLGVRLVASIRERFSVDLPLKTVFERADLEAMAAAIDTLKSEDRGGSASAPTIARRSRRSRPTGSEGS